MTSAIGIVKIQNIDDVLICIDFSKEEKNYLEEKYSNNNLCFEKYNLDTLTVNDFLDELEFSDYRDFIIITNELTIRMENILSYIRGNLEINISVYNAKINSFFINDTNSDLDYSFYFSEEDDIEQRLQNSYECLYQGVYNYNENIHIKHLYIDDIKDLNKIHSSIFRNCSFNSLILFSKAPKGEILELDSNIYSKIMGMEDFMSKIRKISFLDIKKDDVLEDIIRFSQEGTLENNHYLIRDFGKYFFEPRIYSLFIKNEKIYYDSQYSICLSEDINTSVNELLHELNSLKSKDDFNSFLTYDYYLGHLLSFQYNKKIQIISRNTNRYLENYSNIKKMPIFNEWLAFIVDNQGYFLHKLTLRLFKVNEEFLKVYEYIIKEAEGYMDLKLVNDVKRMLNNANE
ncbi:hypothetical protein G4D61_17495 [Bacillus ginsengihumi]|uniref:Uncharacterized protein n=1 Tax=Heyndrickxia ginsengihumi TaxID=363870 RepID=A0A6M0PAY0_9BACI|nr:hypothetical protein [Heyndrickxia ginsengihumi]NEY21711.1 hypothetical protein [Heyndrickxia ginsengihumi]